MWFIVFAKKMCNIHFSDGSRLNSSHPFISLLFPVYSSGHQMPSGPEDVQENSEYTLMHPKYQTTGFLFWSCLSLSLFLSLFIFIFFIIPVTEFTIVWVNTYAGFLLHASFYCIIIYCTCDKKWFSLPHFKSRSLGLERGLEFLTYNTTEAFVKT